MATTSVRYIVDDVDAALAFYRDRLGFTEVLHPAPVFAMLSRGDLRLLLSAPSSTGGGGQTLADGSTPAPGGWNRLALEVDDLDAEQTRLVAAGVRLRGGDRVRGIGGDQLLVEDPSRNLVELFEPRRAEARPEGYQVQPIGWVESPLHDVREAPRQGDRGAPDAWLRLRPDVREGVRDLTVGAELFVLTWLHLSRRDELATRPGDDPASPELGVFSTRSPARPNPVGLHRVTIRAIDDGGVLVGPLEAVDGTPVVDLKPVIGADTA